MIESFWTLAVALKSSDFLPASHAGLWIARDLVLLVPGKELRNTMKVASGNKSALITFVPWPYKWGGRITWCLSSEAIGGRWRSFNMWKWDSMKHHEGGLWEQKCTNNFCSLTPQMGDRITSDPTSEAIGGRWRSFNMWKFGLNETPWMWPLGTKVHLYTVYSKYGNQALNGHNSVIIWNFAAKFFWRLLVTILNLWGRPVHLPAGRGAGPHRRSCATVLQNWIFQFLGQVDVAA